MKKIISIILTVAMFFSLICISGAEGAMDIVADKVEVDYTKIKNVRHSPAKRLGLVIYTDFSSIVVKPNEHKNFIK